jgi:hypothetical protein
LHRNLGAPHTEAQRKITYHRVVNDIVHLDPGFEQAWFTAYFMTVGLGLDDVRRSMIGN